MSDAGLMLRSPVSWRIPSHWIVLGVLFVGALAAGYAMLPGQTQRIAMLERDGQAEEALGLLERSYRRGDRSLRTLLQLQALYEQLGQLDKARSVLSEMVLLQPRETTVVKRALSFYRMTQDRPAYVSALRAQLAIRYSEDACKELIALLRLESNWVEEQAAIQSCRQRGYRRPEDTIRLANLLAAGGDLTQASMLLRGVDDLRRLKTDKDRTKLIASLLEIDQPREAYRRALRWLRGSHDAQFALAVISQLADVNRHDDAIALAREVSAPGDPVSLAVAELMLDRGEPLAAKSYLRGWIEKATLDTAELVSRFIVACLDAEDPAAALAAAKRFGLDKVSQPDLVALAEAQAVLGNQADFDTVRNAIRADVLAENPLLGAAVELQRGAPEAGQSLLSSVPVDELDEWRLALWARLMENTGRTDAAAATLRSMGVEGQPIASRTKATVERGILRRPKRVGRNRPRRVPAISAKSRPGAQPQAPTPFGPNNSAGGG